jgi:hypothetical protein
LDNDDKDNKLAQIQQ